MIFSEKLVVLRKNKGMTQDALAEKLNVSRQAVAKWESGQAYHLPPGSKRKYLRRLYERSAVHSA